MEIKIEINYTIENSDYSKIEYPDFEYLTEIPKNRILEEMLIGHTSGEINECTCNNNMKSTEIANETDTYYTGHWSMTTKVIKNE